MVDLITHVVSTTPSVDESIRDTERTVCQMREGDGGVFVCQCACETLEGEIVPG